MTSDTEGTVARALSVLRVVAEARSSVGVKDVASALNLPMSTSHRLLDLLQRAGFVGRDAERRRYGIGPEFFRLANIVGQDSTLGAVVQPSLDRLTRETGETSLFALYLSGKQAMCFAAKCDSPHALRFRVALYEDIALGRGAAGLAILAFLSAEVQAAVLERTAAPSMHPALFHSRLQKVRAAGVALTRNEVLPDAAEISAPVYSAPNRVAGSITLAIPAPRFSQSKAKLYSELVREIASATFT
jgi:IclR family acetate operon transcriptional repressor